MLSFLPIVNYIYRYYPLTYYANFHLQYAQCLHHITTTFYLFIIPAHHTSPLYLSITSAHHTCPLHLNIIPVHYICTLYLSIIPTHHTCPLHLHIIPVHYTCPLYLPIIPVHYTCALLYNNTSICCFQMLMKHTIATKYQCLVMYSAHIHILRLPQSYHG